MSTPLSRPARARGSKPTIPINKIRPRPVASRAGARIETSHPNRACWRRSSRPARARGSKRQGDAGLSRRVSRVPRGRADRNIIAASSASATSGRVPRGRADRNTDDKDKAMTFDTSRPARARGSKHGGSVRKDDTPGRRVPRGRADRNTLAAANTLGHRVASRAGARIETGASCTAATAAASRPARARGSKLCPDGRSAATQVASRAGARIETRS